MGERDACTTVDRLAREARDRAYEGVARVAFTDMHVRRDIAERYVR